MISKKESENKVSSSSVVVEGLRLIKPFINKVCSLFNTAKSVEDSPQRHRAMTLIYKRHGFTLIELLVVVLIIGILAAIALPKYEKAVMKSRYSGLKPVTRALADAEEAFYLTRGVYDDSEDLSNLDVQKPSDNKISVEFSTTSGHDYVRASHTKLNNRYTQYLKRSKNFGGNIYCEAASSDTKAQQLCVAEGGTDASITRDGYKWYLVHGTSTGSFGYSLTSTTPGSYDGQTISTYSDGENTVTYDMFENLNGGARGRNYVTVCDAQNNCTQQTYYTHAFLEAVLDGGNGTEKTTDDLCTDYPFLQGC